MGRPTSSMVINLKPSALTTLTNVYPQKKRNGLEGEWEEEYIGEDTNYSTAFIICQGNQVPSSHFSILNLH